MVLSQINQWTNCHFSIGCIQVQGRGAVGVRGLLCPSDVRSGMILWRGLDGGTGSSVFALGLSAAAPEEQCFDFSVGRCCGARKVES